MRTDSDGADSRQATTADTQTPKPQPPNRGFLGLDRLRRDGDGFPSRGALRWLFLFRLIVVVGLVIAFSPTVIAPSVEPAKTELAWNILVAYAVLVLLSGLTLSLNRPRRTTQVQLAVLVDILTFTALMHVAGGISSGLGVLPAVSVAAGALLMEGRLSLFFAAVASLAIISQQLYSSVSGGDIRTSFPQAGILGLLYFAVALLSHVLYRRVRRAEALAARRKVDIDDLSKVNDFVIHSIGTGILVADGERRLRLVNQAALELLGVARAKRGARLCDIAPELSEWLASEVQSPYPRDGLLQIGNRDILASIRLLGDYRASGLIIYLRDNREAAQEAQQMKLASLGTLTASIAHNIRNPLSSISHAAQLLSEGPDLSDDDRHLLDIVRRNCARIEDTVESVLQLSRRNQVQPSEIDLTAWVENFARELRESQGLSETALLFELDPDRIRVELDPRHLRQILANLCENALIHGGNEQEDASIHIRVVRAAGRDEAVLEIRDNGPGIDDETAREIFNPFFTTRSQGTGLGLYIARELADSNGLRLLYERLTPRGSCFRLILPLA